jgi:hypothetical protein
MVIPITVIPYRTAPPALPVRLCSEVAWEIIHTPVLSNEDKQKVLANLARRCAFNLGPAVVPPTGWPP